MAIHGWIWVAVVSALPSVAVGCGDSGTDGTSGTGAAGMAAGTGAAGTVAGMGAAGTAAGTGAAGTAAGTGASGTGASGTGAAGTAAGAGAAGTAAGTGAAGTAAGTGAAGTTAGTGAAGTGGGTLGGPLTYTGTFTMGTTIPARHKCLMPFGGGTGENVSPPLAWSGGPVETQSFAIVLFDTRYDMLHWVLWDIPPTVNELPEGLASGFELTEPAGAHQAAGMGDGYYGPCSSAGPTEGTYEYRLYALDTAMLPLTESSTAADAQAAVEAAMLEMVVWTGTPE